MCGIIGYLGPKNACDIVFNGLKKLEYRGYDSWGMAFLDNESGLRNFKLVREVGKVSEKKIENLFAGKAIGHTRWATHGEVNLTNTHPILSQNRRLAVVHNGIVENYQELKKELTAQGFAFITGTDTEVISNLIQHSLSSEKNLVKAVAKACKRLEGRFAFLLMSLDSDELIAVKKGSPLVIGKTENEFFISSDLPAFLDHTKNAIFLEDEEIASINKTLKIFDFNNKKINKKFEEINVSIELAEKKEFKHFMLKEIFDQKESISRSINQDDKLMKKASSMIKNSGDVWFVGCGTAAKVARLAPYLFSIIADKKVQACIGSEFKNFSKFLSEESIVIGVSQSGETADTLVALEEARKKKAKIISIINAEATSMHRLSDFVIPVKAGQERAVASTKATTGQIAILILLAHYLAGKEDKGKEGIQSIVRDLTKLYSQESLNKIEFLADIIKEKESIYLIGRKLSYLIALEGAIKLQEVSYIHAEGFTGGELKHGPLALIEKGTPTIVLTQNDDTLKELLGNAQEIKARGGFIIGVGEQNNELFDYFIQTYRTCAFDAITLLIPIQLLAYYLSIKKGLNPDYPRNLAKSVTVK
ncbi:MAG TPA: glutamine--fructose-6-phosphate transaminase (isomerizing) [archaeon]|nr:glutamine--fructose-6-phosphate transaminase (isomerizing) [archaeon]